MISCRRLGFNSPLEQQIFNFLFSPSHPSWVTKPFSLKLAITILQSQVLTSIRTYLLLQGLMVGLADDGLAVDGLLEVPGGGCGTRPTSTSRQDSYSSCGSFLSPSQYDGTASDMGSCYDIMEDEVSVRYHSIITSSKRWVGGVRNWQFLMIYSTVNHQRGGWA